MKVLHVFLVLLFVDAFLCFVVDELPVHLMGLSTPATLLAVIVVAVVVVRGILIFLRSGALIQLWIGHGGRSTASKKKQSED